MPTKATENRRRIMALQNTKGATTIDLGAPSLIPEPPVARARANASDDAELSEIISRMGGMDVDDSPKPSPQMSPQGSPIPFFSDQLNDVARGVGGLIRPTSSYSTSATPSPSNQELNPSTQKRGRSDSYNSTTPEDLSVRSTSPIPRKKTKIDPSVIGKGR